MCCMLRRRGAFRVGGVVALCTYLYIHAHTYLAPPFHVCAHIHTHTHSSRRMRRRGKEYLYNVLVDISRGGMWEGGGRGRTKKKVKINM